MTVNDINSKDFFGRLVAVYGDEAEFQQKRYSSLASQYEADFGTAENLRFFSAPGRTEVGGNHTDHNNGKVLAAAINLDAVAAVEKRTDSIINVNSEGYSTLNVDSDDLEIKDQEAGKSNAHIRGVCA
ncbi:MAG: galactokinase family protein, partial [Oscillospiraceae bacterium]|nr:galactokinase family protein [Oscillospiraceae bacterium]